MNDVCATEVDNQALNQYLSLVRLTDEKLRELVEYFDNQEEDTVIVFFGDHQPSDSVVAPIWKLNGKDSDSLSKEDSELRYMVPYFIWANYDIQTEINIETSANYLSTRILQAASLPLSDFTNYLDTLQKNYPVLTNIRVVDSLGNSSTVKEVEQNVNDYAIMQYYQLFGHK